MRTSILVGNVLSPERACLPSEVPENKQATYKVILRPKGMPLGSTSDGKETFQPHDVLVCRGFQFSMTPAGNVKEYKSCWDGKKCDARVIDPEFVTELDNLDKQIEELTKRRKEVIAEAWVRARKLNRKDIQQATNQTTDAKER